MFEDTPELHELHDAYLKLSPENQAIARRLIREIIDALLEASGDALKA